MGFKYIGFVGCYTKPGQADPFEASHGGIPHDRSRVGKGVLSIGVGSDGKLVHLNNGDPVIKADALPNPSYLSFNGHIGKEARLCVVSELEGGKWQPFSVCFDEKHSVVKLEAAGEKLGTGGSYPCHIIHAHSALGVDLLFISNYGEDQGVFSIVSTNPLLVEVKPNQVVFGAGSNGNFTRQQTSHAHSSCVAPSTSPKRSLDVCAVDLGSDSIIQFSLTQKSDVTTLECNEIGRLAAPAGSGPRSLMFNPNKALSNVAVVSLEMTAQVWLIRRRPHDGCLEGLSTPVSILPENWPDDCTSESQFNRGRWASDAVWSPDGKYVYAAARLHDSISVFKLNYTIDTYRQPASPEGCPKSVNVEKLELVQRINTGGKTPRCLAVTECGEFLLVAHQHSHDVASFRRDLQDGTLTFINRLDANCAACVKLARSELVKL
ncbi:hypothetical protein ACHAXN_004455 [Cyclotella atomus]